MSSKQLFEFLKSIDSESILCAIENEYPQTIAVVVACMQPEQAAYIIEGLPPERQHAVVRRIATMRKVELEVLRELEEELKLQIADQRIVDIGGVSVLGEILGCVGPQNKSYILENLSQDDSELVKELEQSISVANAICRLEKAGKIIRN
jgi:flagellar motor switch protein FliG